VTIAVAILVSGFVSLSLTPMLCSRFLRPPSNTHGIFYRALERVFDGMLRIYDWTLRRVLRARLAVMLLSIVLLLVTGYLFVIIPKGFIPAQDTNQIFGVTEGPQDVSYDAMVAYQQAVDAVIARDPNVVSLVSTINRGTLNTGFVFARLKPRSERTLSAEEIIEQLRPQLAAVPGIRVYLQVPPLIQIGGQLTKSLYQYTLQSSDMEELHQWAPRIASELRKLPGFQDVTTDLQIQSPQVVVAIDRDKASSLGVTAAQIENALADAYGSRQVSTIYTPTNEYWVIMELEPRYQRDPNALSLLYVRSASGRLVPLNAVARLTPGVGPLTVNHFGQTPAVTVSFNLQPGVSLGGAVTALEDVVQRINLPATITTSFQGTAQAFQSSLGGMGLLLLMAVAVIYMVLGILYESFVHPITILSGLPSAGLGALLTLMVFGDELNVYSLVGIIMLIGIVKKNAIMMIDFALDAQRGEGKSAAAAIYEACLIRFRPIMMTTMAALMGTLPIALAFGAGGEARRPLGLAVVGGLLVSQLLTLYLTPVYFIYLDRFSTLFRRRKAPRAHPTPTPAPESVT
ncbi:MAG TPA: efflux RND transporter permease subunit, partial [Bryobacteraceae bacterium]|nr:efflux RND transporter permease subunit [Bryobacteraceae bacterium]